MRIEDGYFLSADGMEGGMSAPAEPTVSEGAAEGSSSVTETSAETDSMVGAMDDKDAIYSEKGSFRMTRDASGKPVIRMNIAPAPVVEEKPVEKPQEPVIVQESQTMSDGNEQLAGLVGGLSDEPKEYTANDMMLAMQLGTVDESRIPAAYREQYQAYKQNTIRNPPSAEPQTAELPKKDANAAEYYARINQMAEDMAMQEIGITQEELDAEDFSDDDDLKQKVKAYKTAVEANRGRILADVQAEVQKGSQMQAEYRAANEAISAFYQKALKEEPNFREIDRMMATRVNELPYREAVKLVPTLERLKNGTITRAELPILEQFYKDTRMEYYARKNDVGRAPAAVRPPAVETAGNGAELSRKFDPTDLAKMRSFREKARAIGKVLKYNP
jgi:hypothetical protein